MSNAPELVSRVRHALAHAGFHLVGEVPADNRPGLRVTEDPSGVLITWTASDGFSALASNQLAPGDSMKAIVQAAVSGLLLQLGHTVTKPPHEGDLLVLPEGPHSGA
ncbi:hypothetical protein C8250_000100 [Streptomyces sp. So13.3]|uniref:hypothetical protein n=1 Tax=Streptomyces TaxID=1883 RepID=UPI0011063AE1|nr:MULTISPECIES: hypothetical protein [Streptomyces]MCZ4103448.1 hypothetical protein [Streptomyces sp. H39-C1]QNA70580.1 hypothetical protein C8250_000100 [Streptomyces sp. So13.3]